MQTHIQCDLPILSVALRGPVNDEKAIKRIIRRTDLLSGWTATDGKQRIGQDSRNGERVFTMRMHHELTFGLQRCEGLSPLLLPTPRKTVSRITIVYEDKGDLPDQSLADIVL